MQRGKQIHKMVGRWSGAPDSPFCWANLGSTEWWRPNRNGRPEIVGRKYSVGRPEPSPAYQPVVQVWMRRQEMLKYPQAWFVECAHGNGDAQAAGEARGHLDCAHRVSVSSGTPLLPAAE